MKRVLFKECERFSSHLSISPIAILMMSLLLISSGCSKKSPASVLEEPHYKQLSNEFQPKILVLHSYHYGYEWVRAINRGISLGLSSRPDIEIQYLYMDTKRQTDTSWKQQIAAEAMQLIHDWQPDVVIAADDNAQDLIGRKIAGQAKPAWVFCGVNHEPERYGYPAENVTGVLERVHFIESLNFFSTIFPNAGKIVFISDDSTTSEGTIRYCQSLTDQLPGSLSIIDWQTPSTLSQWKETIARYDDSVDAFAIYTYHTLKDGDAVVAPNEVMQWTVEHSRVPIIGFLNFSGDDGAFCGVFESAVQQGQLAAAMALQIVEGAKPQSLAITTPKASQKCINMNIARQLGIHVPSSVLQDTDLLIND